MLYSIMCSLLLVAYFILGCTGSTDSGDKLLPYPVGDVRNCLEEKVSHNQSFNRMAVFPGIGFDNLRDIDMGQVIEYNFSKCQVSNDGKYLLPNNMILIPSQESKIDVFAEHIQHWDDYTSMTSASIAVHFGYMSFISAKFSAGYSQAKSHMVSEKSDQTRVQVRNKICTVKLQPNAELHPAFKNRLYDIVANFQNNNTEVAHYLAELVIRDYGTHVITSIDAGAILSQTDYIKQDNSEDSAQRSIDIKASASANFFVRLSVGINFKYISNNTSGYVNNRTHSYAMNVGGPPLTPNTTLDEWEKGVPDALAPIDRAGDPLQFIININTLPSLSDDTVLELAGYVEKAASQYYRANTHPGCTDPTKSNFNFEANLDNGHCDPQSTNFTLGGIYQTCIMDSIFNTVNLCSDGPQPLLQKNPITGDYSCPSYYEKVNLYSGKFTHNIQQTKTKRCGFLHTKHCSYQVTLTSIAYYQTYWCAAAPGKIIPQDEGFLFGGYFTSKQTNPITGAMSCPHYFYSVQMLEDVKVCVSTDYDRGLPYSVDFGGMESCTMGNPLAYANASDFGDHWPHSCSSNHKHHLIAVEHSCEINVCIREQQVIDTSKSLIARVPPYRRHPKIRNSTMTLAVFGKNGLVFVKNKNGIWDEVDSTTTKGLAFLQQSNVDLDKVNQNNQRGSQGSTIAFATVIGTLILGILVIVAVFTSRFVYKRYKKKHIHRKCYAKMDDQDIDNTEILEINKNSAAAV